MGNELNKLIQMYRASPRQFAGGGQVRGFFQGGTDGVPIEDIAQSAIDSAETPEAGMAGVQTLLDKYYPSGGDYAGDVKSARARADKESEAFMNMMQGFMENPDNARNSKAEMYFRLAAAFGSPTKTGSFGENLAMANTELADYAKGQRATAADKLQTQMEIQKLKMQSAKEDLGAARDLATTDMSNRRAIASDLIKEYIASGKPQSAAGKTAVDLGFKPGTDEYNAKVKELVQIDIDKTAAELNAAQTRASDPASNLGKLAVDMGFEPGTLPYFAKVQELADAEAEKLAALTASTLAQTAATEDKQNKPTSQEIDLRIATEDKIAGLTGVLDSISTAYDLNPMSFDGGWMGGAQQFAFEALDPTDERVVATNRIRMLMQEQALGQLKAIFGGAPSDKESSILLDMQGLGAKGKKERAQIMQRAYEIVKDRQAREQQRLKDILSGKYRTEYTTEEPAP
jgi:hypothetical protein